MTGEEKLFDGMAEMFENDAGAGAPPPVPKASEAPPPKDEQPKADLPKDEKPKEPVRDEHGRFAPPVVEKPKEAPQPLAKQPIEHEQFKGYLEERDKRKAAEERAERVERELSEARKKLEAPVQGPSFFENPDAWAAHQQAELQRALLVERINTSEFHAREKHGDETVTAAIKWGEQQLSSVPGFANQQISQRHPIDWLVKQYRRNELMNQVGDDPDAWVRKRYAELAANPQQQSQSPQSPKAAPQKPEAEAPPPPRSIVDEPSAGGGMKAAVAMGWDAPFDAVFKK